MPASTFSGNQDGLIVDMYIRQVSTRLQMLPVRNNDNDNSIPVLHRDHCVLQGEALISMGKWQEGLMTYRSGLSACGTHDRSQFIKALAASGSPLTADLLAQVSVWSPRLSCNVVSSHETNGQDNGRNKMQQSDPALPAMCMQFTTVQ